MMSDDTFDKLTLNFLRVGMVVSVGLMVYGAIVLF